MAGIDRSLYRDGIRFECQGSSKCCRFRAGYSHIYVTLCERRRLANLLGMQTATFTRAYCIKSDDFYELKSTGDACIFLEESRCSVYEARPGQCRSWPFWPENMSRRGWQSEVLAFCPGVGKGRVYPAEEIEGILQIELRRE
jgi:Fe-S-cluster containining protein